MTWMRITSWTLTREEKYKLHIMRFENARNVTPDIAVSETQLACIIEESFRQLNPGTVRQIIATWERETKLDG